jgi:cytoskeletal protein RodZ
MDVDDIPLGVDFSKYIDEKVGKCEVFLAIIGRDWLRVTDADGNRRLDMPDDFVRLELESALHRNIPVIPLLVRRGSMPKAGDLPESIRELSKRNGMQIRPDPDFRTDCDRLIEGLERDRTGKRPIVSKRQIDPVEKQSKPKSKRLMLGVMGVAVISALIGFFVWFSNSQAPAPAIVEFQANPNRINKGESTELRWTTRNARKVTIHPTIGTVTASGSKTISPTDTTTYTLAVIGSDRQRAKQALSIQVNPQASVPSASLSATESTILSGRSTTLRWRTTNATEVMIQPGIGRVRTSGTKQVSPRENTTYTLTAKSPAGTKRSTVSVRVTPRRLEVIR